MADSFDRSADPPTSPQLILRPQTAQDALQLAFWLTDPQAEWRQWDAPFMQGEGPTSQAADDSDIGGADEAPHERLIVLEDQAIGLVTRRPEAPSRGGWWEVGILIYDPRHWGGGLGTRALRTWTALTFAETGAHLLTLSTWSGNIRMLRAAGRVGYRECARVREARLWQGQRYDSVQMDLLRREWARLAGPEAPLAQEPLKPTGPARG